MSFPKSRRFSYPGVAGNQKTVVADAVAKSLQNKRDRSRLRNIRLCESTENGDVDTRQKCDKTPSKITNSQKKNVFRDKISSRISSPGPIRSKNIPSTSTSNKQEKALRDITNNIAKDVDLNETFSVNIFKNDKCRRNKGEKDIYRVEADLNADDTIFHESDTSLSWDNFETELGDILENCVQLERVLKDDNMDTVGKICNEVDKVGRLFSMEENNEMAEQLEEEKSAEGVGRNEKCAEDRETNSGIMATVETAVTKAQSKIKEFFQETICKIKDDTERKLKAVIKDINETNQTTLEETQNQCLYTIENLHTTLNDTVGKVVENNKDANYGDCRELRSVVTVLSEQLEESQMFVKYLEFSYTNLLKEAGQKITKQTRLISALKTELDSVALEQNLERILKTQNTKK